jgi:hypothetical protein
MLMENSRLLYPTSVYGIYLELTSLEEISSIKRRLGIGWAPTILVDQIILGVGHSPVRLTTTATARIYAAPIRCKIRPRTILRIPFINE